MIPRIRLLLCFIVFWAIGSCVVAEPVTVEIGMYVLDVAHLDVKESEFYADFYIWYKAPSTASWTPDNIEFMNGNIENATQLVLAPIAGKNVWSQRIKGRFRGHFLLHSYPFDAQMLPIVIEDAETQSNVIVFQPDSDSSKDFNTWLEPEMNVPDWERSGASCSSDVHHYKTDFGQSNRKGSDYSRFTFKLFLKRLFMPHLIKFILPLIIIAGMAYTVFFINASEFETQCAICVTALLSAVALHISQADALPAVGYLLMSDKIFILFYVVIFSALVQTVVNNNYAKRRRFDMAIYLDKKFRIWYVAFLIAGNILVFLLS
ncbi:MAG: hypothetical protein EOM80_10265 [Erysipelotrichia bacterium]|nr:hypothetical protein [Erysipelotrichia bacterium]